MSGCAWHCCPLCGCRHPFKKPADIVHTKDNRDILNANQLGYDVLIIWEHELKDEDAVINKILVFNDKKEVI